MNPARSLGPALVAGEWRDAWVYVAGPPLGTALGALAYQLVRDQQPRPATRDDRPWQEAHDGQRPLRLPA